MKGERPKEITMSKNQLTKVCVDAENGVKENNVVLMETKNGMTETKNGKMEYQNSRTDEKNGVVAGLKSKMYEEGKQKKKKYLEKEEEEEMGEFRRDRDVFQELLKHAGGCGKWQVWLFFITSINGIFFGPHNVASG